MPHARPKSLQPTNGSGVVLNIEWFKEDPGDDRDIQPDLYDQALIPAASVEDVTDEMIADAIAQHLPVAEAEFAPKPEPSASASRSLGKVFDGRAVAQERRAAKGGQ